jgi:hypothetical protein
LGGGDVLVNVFQEVAGDLLVLLDEFRTAVNVKVGGISSIEDNNVKDLVEAFFGHLFLMDTTDTVGAINENGLLFILVVKTHFGKEIKGLGNSTSEIFIILLKKFFRLVVELGKVLSMLLVENQNHIMELRSGDFTEIDVLGSSEGDSFHQGSNQKRATGSGITTDEDVAFLVPVNGLAVVELVDEEIFEHLASFTEVFNVGEIFNIFLEFSLHHKSILADELDTVILVGVVGGSDLDTNNVTLVELGHVRSKDTRSEGDVFQVLSSSTETSSTVADSSTVELVDVDVEVFGEESLVSAEVFRSKS